MKIIFHPSYDGGYYVDLCNGSDRKLGTKMVGLAGLLEHLCLHNGLSGRFASDGERAASYLAAVGKCADGSILETSFRNDSLGVAKCVLRWRDLLIMQGWTPEMNDNDPKSKLSLLSRIEKCWKDSLKGSADRWHELSLLDKVNACGTIECRCAKKSLPVLVQRTLEKCNAKFLEFDSEISLADKDNIRVWHYKDLLDVFRQVASDGISWENTLFVNRDNVSLNHMLFAWGKPLVDARIQDSNPPALQLFKLAMSVFSRPLNIQNLLSYLQLPCGPISRSVRSELAWSLEKNGGFGEVNWDKIDMVKGFNSLASYITDESLEPDKEILASMLIDYIKSIMTWATLVISDETVNDAAYKTQLRTVILYFKQLQDIIKGMDGIRYDELEKHIRTIYRPTTIVQAKAQVGSLKIVNDITQMVDVPKRLVWLDCCGADQKVDEYEFLSTAERNWLNSQAGVEIPLLSDILDMNRKEMIACLEKIDGEIVLVKSDYYQNNRMAEHPVIAELKMLKGETLIEEEGKMDLPLKDSQCVKEVEPKVEYDLGEMNFPDRSQSNTSIDTLINYPFDYTVNYIARLSEPSINDMASMNRIEGLVAHSFIENLVNDVKDLKEKERVPKLKDLADNEFDKRVNAAINSTGLIMLLKENEVELHNFKALLKRSIETLIFIMIKKELVPVGCEIKHEKELTDIGDFNARIDMELKDKSGRAVILDFKWTYAKSYGDKIKEGKSLQLELYRQELMKEYKDVGAVSAVGYYLLPKCVLETADYDTLKDAEGNIVIRKIEGPDVNDLFEKIRGSFKERKAEIESGRIEEGEGMDIKDLPYAKRIEEGEVILEIGKTKRETKKNKPTQPILSVTKDVKKVYTSAPESRFTSDFADFGDANIPVKEKATSYPLMKGHLK